MLNFIRKYFHYLFKGRMGQIFLQEKRRFAKNTFSLALFL